ncbi:hypothetical protein QUF76_07190 [Desulfobacterales bacterium HSG16]|nr:hypothetical protein [Desulfobacterales bacterium HSG16]
MNITEAIESALKAVVDCHPKRCLKDVAVEEAESDEDEGCWSVTVGYDMSVPSISRKSSFTGVSVFPEKYVRKYKVFEIDSKDGKIISMRSKK